MTSGVFGNPRTRAHGSGTGDECNEVSAGRRWFLLGNQSELLLGSRDFTGGTLLQLSTELSAGLIDKATFAGESGAPFDELFGRLRA